MAYSVCKLNVPGSSGAKGIVAEDICLKCGLCCNGVIFADVRLQAGDVPRRLHLLGIPLKLSRRQEETTYEPSSSKTVALRQIKLHQPCAALEGCRCAIYPDRPKHCRNFECGVLKAFREGAIQRRTALHLIRLARASAERVMELLRRLGDTDEELALSFRFRRTARRLEEIGLEKSVAEVYADLTLAVHDLNYLLSEAFYPGRNIAEYIELEGIV